MEKTIITKSEDETKAQGELIGRDLFPGSIIILVGDLGSGKTTFTKGLAKGIGVKKRIISPTFTIIRMYEIKNNQKTIKNLYHIDLYRLESSDETQNLGLEEIIGNKENVVVVEWPEKIQHLLPKNRIEIYLNTISDTEREIHITDRKS